MRCHGGVGSNTLSKLTNLFWSCKKNVLIISGTVLSMQRVRLIPQPETVINIYQ